MTFSSRGFAPRTTGRVGKEAKSTRSPCWTLARRRLAVRGRARALTATAALLPHVSSPAGVGASRGGGSYSTVGRADASPSPVKARRPPRSPGPRTCGVVVLVALCLCAAAGGRGAARSACSNLFAIGHARGLPSRAVRLLLVAIASLAGFLAPPRLHACLRHVRRGRLGRGGAWLCSPREALHLASNDPRAALAARIPDRATADFDSSLDPQQTLRQFAGTAVPEPRSCA